MSDTERRTKLYENREWWTSSCAFKSLMADATLEKGTGLDKNFSVASIIQAQLNSRTEALIWTVKIGQLIPLIV
jgi:hypothetical protein